MSFHKSLLFSLLISLFFSSTLSHFPTSQTPPASGTSTFPCKFSGSEVFFFFNPFSKFSFSGEFFEGNYFFGTKRSLAEGPSDEAPLNSSYLVLAAKRTHRRDPSDDFNKYTGGWNISEPHYWTVSHSNLESLCLFVFLFVLL